MAVIQSGSGVDDFSLVVVNGKRELLGTDISSPGTLILDLKEQ